MPSRCRGRMGPPRRTGDLMPINPAHRHHYRTPEYLAAREIVVARAAGRCEACGVRNGDAGYRDYTGDFHQVTGDAEAMEAEADGHRLITIVLTVAHLDHDAHLGVHNPARMMHLCQKDHLRLDGAQHVASAAATRDRKRAVAAIANDEKIGQQRLLEAP